MDVIELDTPSGVARAHIGRPVLGAGVELLGALVLGHGAGGGVGAADLVASAEVAMAVPALAVLVEQPYRVAGRRSPPPARTLDAAWIAVIDGLRAGAVGALPLVVGGRSSGARVACRTAGATGAVGVLCLAFPLHPPGRADDPAKSRLPELDGVTAPTLVVQGERDPFGMPTPGPGREVVVVPGDHALRSVAAVRDAVDSWLPALFHVAAAVGGARGASV